MQHWCRNRSKSGIERGGGLAGINAEVLVVKIEPGHGVLPESLASHLLLTELFAQPALLDLLRGPIGLLLFEVGQTDDDD